MKIVALMPVRNEAHVLPTCLSSLLPIVDQIVALDDGSVDGSGDLIRDAGGLVESLPPPDGVRRPISRHRQRLIELGREVDGTHFVWLDADEAFTGPFRQHARAYIEALEPGHKLMMQWLALWRDTRSYRDDDSRWSNAFKDFIVADDGSPLVIGHEHEHEGRTNGPNLPERLHRVPLEDGAVLHFQFASWERFQTKQAWLRCWERVIGLRTPAGTNRLYRSTMDEDRLRTSPVPPEWYDGLVPPTGLEDLPPGWYQDEILGWFDQHGIEHFEPLEVWHVPRLRQEFVGRTGREPRPQHPAVVTASALQARVVGKLRSVRARVRS